MATRVPTTNFAIGGYSGNRCGLITWSGLLGSPVDDGTPFVLADFREASVQVSGTFGVGGTVVLEGSNDGTAYTTLESASITPAAISLTSAGLLVLRSAAFRLVRPRVTGGDGTTTLVVSLCVRRDAGL